MGLLSPECSYTVHLMATDIHVWLPDDEAAALKSRATLEDRSITNMARKLIREGLQKSGASTETRIPIPGYQTPVGVSVVTRWADPPHPTPDAPAARREGDGT